MIEWIETFPDDEDEEQLPTLNYITRATTYYQPKFTTHRFARSR